MLVVESNSCHIKYCYYKYKISWNRNKEADAASLALQRIKHSIKQEIGFLHIYRSSLYHKKYQTKSAAVA